ncbi:MAG TPA: glycosyltransferase family 39 protein [Patescibacteria group bacterium]|nr:glycosyltransferase family 39 protein [Patescibacteria group bacterium]
MKRKDLLLCLVLCFIVAAAFFPSLSNGFTNFDDNAYLTANPLVRSLAPANIKRIFTTTRPHTIFVPMVTLTFALEYRLWKLDPRGYHAVNLLLHIFNALLVFFLIRGVSGSLAVAFFTSLFFALHPLRVESVAWVTERKDLLFTFFFLLALQFYIRYLKKDSGRDYLLSISMFAFAIFSKMSALVLPAVLLLMDWKVEARISKKRWLEKIPFAVILLLYAISSWNSVQAFSVQYSGQYSGGRHQVIMKNSLWVIPFYLQKTIWPSRLSAHYPTDMRFFMPSLWFSIFYSIILIGGSFLLLKKFRREWLWGWGFFLIALLPVFGPVWQFFPVANRYSYLPAIGLSYVLVMAVSLAGEKLARWKNLRSLWTALAVSTLIILGTASFLRCHVWKDSISLWNDVIGKYPMIPLAYNSRGNALQTAGRLDEAQEDYSRAIQLMSHGSFYWNRGLARLQKNQAKEAIEDFYAAILKDPKYFQMFCQMTVDTHGRSGYERVIYMGKRLIAARPDSRVHMKMAEAFIRLRRWQEADFHLQEAVRLSPHVEEYRRALQVFREALHLPSRRFEEK